MGCFKKFALIMALVTVVLSFAACSPIDKNYGVESEVAKVEDNSTPFTEKDKKIMSSDRIMGKYFDISLFDEENYADIYLGKRFKIDASYADYEIKVPSKLDEMEKIGWNLSEGNIYAKGSLVFAYETVDATLEDKNGLKMAVQFYNSSKSSVKLSECYIVKFRIINDFYENPQGYKSFDVNGINNQMAITDIINILGTPSHFYKVADNNYYLDYFITKKDRRNGITVYINPQDDSITSIEFSYYK